MICLGRDLITLMLLLYNNYKIVTMERSLTNEDTKQYAYLSIDQVRRTYNPRMTLGDNSMN